jgi:predicted permease
MTSLNSIIPDIRYALRQLRRSPGFAATAILTLALGIGATTAIFTLVYQVMLRSLPVAHPEQLYKLGKESCGNCTSGGLQDDWRVFSTDQYHSLRDQTPGIAGMAASEAGAVGASVRKAGDDAAAQVLAVRFVSGNYFSLLGVRTYQGRTLRPDDDREGAPPVAVVSYTLWRNKFGADPHLVGSTLLLTGHPVTVVGITAPNFLGERNESDPPGLWAPLPFEPTLEPDRSLNRFPGDGWLNLLVRIPDPSRIAPAGQAIAGELRRWIDANRGIFPEAFTAKELARQTTELVSAASGINDLRDQYQKSLKLLLLVAGFVLLIACANLANLMLVRGMARQQELAVRSALGAPRTRLVRQMLVEAVLLALGGGAAAVGVAYAGAQAILALAMRGAEVDPIQASPSLPILGFAFAVSLITGLLFGTAPAWITSRTNPVEALRGANRSTGDASALPQKLLVILQAALSLALLSTAGLLITSLRHLEHQNFHFDPDGRLIALVDLQSAGYSYDKLGGLYQRMDDTFGHMPGVESFAYATYGPMAFSNWATDVFFPGRDASEHNNAFYTYGSAHYFETIGTRVLLGRGFSESDSTTGAKVAVVNQTFVTRYLKGKQPIGERFGPDPKMPGAYEIVGVVEDTKYGNPSAPARPMYFAPLTQASHFADERDNANERLTHFAGNLILHYRGDSGAMAASFRRALKGIDPNIAIFTMRTYNEQLSANFTQEELVVRLTTLFGLLALVLASIGLYGVTAYAVARRTSEIGIRMALGASRSGVLRMVVRGTLTQAGIGLAVGLPLAFAAGKLLQHTLYQTSGFQPFVLVAVIALLLASTLIAAMIPARRAASIDPMQALRAE